MMDVRERAVSYLNVKPRTRQQVMVYLRNKGFQEEDILEAVRELEEYHYIDDLSYSRMYFQYGFEKGRGVVRIKRELSEKGVDSHVIEAAYDELEDVPDQYEVASEIAAGMTAGVDWEQMGYEDARRLQAKIGRRLMTRGFSSDIVYKVINRLK